MRQADPEGLKEENVFVNKIVGGVVPREYIPGIEKGLKAAYSRGVIAGYPIVDIKATLTFGSYHDVDSNELSFKLAASKCFREASKKAKPVLLEPVMLVEVNTPEEYMGEVLGGLNSKRGQIIEMTERGLAKIIRANVPLSEMFGYATDLRSSSQGRATYVMEFAHYAQVPNAILRRRSEQNVVWSSKKMMNSIQIINPPNWGIYYYSIVLFLRIIGTSTHMIRDLIEDIL
jgi:elongation factor G